MERTKKKGRNGKQKEEREREGKNCFNNNSSCPCKHKKIKGRMGG